MLRTSLIRSLRQSTPPPTLASTSNARFFSTSIINMSLNRSGLTAEQSKALPTRQPTDEEKKVIEGISELYKCQPTDSAYQVYSKDAVFHDPIGIAKGLELIKAQFNSLPKLFEKSTIDRLVVLKNPSALPESTILIDQDVSYYRKKDTVTKTVNSLLTLERDASGKITGHYEEWDHKRETDSSDGFFGSLNEIRKGATAKLTGAFTTSDPNKV